MLPYFLLEKKKENNGYQHFENRYTIRYTEILWSETIGLCKKLNIIYNIITPNPDSDSFLRTGSCRQFVSMN